MEQEVFWLIQHDQLQHGEDVYDGMAFVSTSTVLTYIKLYKFAGGTPGRGVS